MLYIFYFVQSLICTITFYRQVIISVLTPTTNKQDINIIDKTHSIPPDIHCGTHKVLEMQCKHAVIL